VMVFFGAPIPQEDHAERAVRAAISLHRRMAEWNLERAAEGLDEIKVRTAINSGVVVVGDIGSANRVDYTILGNTVNVTARLEELVAKPSQIVIGPATFKAVENLFPIEHLGNVALRGLQGKTPVYRIAVEQLPEPAPPDA